MMDAKSCDSTQTLDEACRVAFGVLLLEGFYPEMAPGALRGREDVDPEAKDAALRLVWAAMNEIPQGLVGLHRSCH